MPRQSYTFTIFCHGTGRHRGRKAWDIVQVMHNTAAGTDGVDFLILDGPAGKPEWVPRDLAEAQCRNLDHVDTRNNGTEIKDRHLMAGDFDPYADTLTPKERGMLNPTYANMVGGTLHTTLQGKGVGSNVKHALFVVRNKVRADLGTNRKLGTINLMGWSRGAVTCIKIANALYNQPATRRIKVNMFLVDPVPGSSHYDQADSHNIPPNVANMIVLLAMHEKRDGFKPVDFSSVRFNGNPLTEDNADAISERCNHLWLPMPGVHNSVPQPHTPLLSPGMIGFQLCRRFLEHHGTVFDVNPFAQGEYPLSDKTMCKLYAGMMNSMGVYEKHGHKEHGFFKGGSEHVRMFNQELYKYRMYGGLFLNEHHRFCFCRAYPNLGAGFRRFDAPVELDDQSAELFCRSFTPLMYPDWDELGVVSVAGDVQNIQQFWADPLHDELKQVGGWDDIKDEPLKSSKKKKLKQIKAFKDL